jgi:hypothetical protein
MEIENKMLAFSLSIAWVQPYYKCELKIQYFHISVRWRFGFILSDSFTEVLILQVLSGTKTYFELKEWQLY